MEATGHPEVLKKILHASSSGSTHLLLGLPYGNHDFNFETIVGYDKTVVGSVGSSGTEFEEAISILPKIETSAFLEQMFPLSDFAQAWEIVRAQKHLKVILQVDPWPNGIRTR